MKSPISNSLLAVCLLFFSQQLKAAHRPTGSKEFHADLFFLYNDNSTYPVDGAAAQYRDDFSAGVDYLDAAKFSNMGQTEFCFKRNGKRLSIERRPTVHVNDTLFFDLTNTTKRNYQFQLTTIELEQPGLYCYLRDKYTNDSIPVDLNGLTTYNFSITDDIASQLADRFIIIYATQLDAGPVPVTYTSVNAQQQANNILVKWNVANQMNVKNYSVERSSNGYSFTTLADMNAINSSTYNWTDGNQLSAQNYYRIRSTDMNGSVQYSEIVTASNDDKNTGISIYPNPVTNGVINLKLVNLPSGVYQLYLLNITGQRSALKPFTYTSGTQTQTISINKTLSKGAYQLEIVQPGNRRSFVTILCQ